MLIKSKTIVYACLLSLSLTFPPVVNAQYATVGAVGALTKVMGAILVVLGQGTSAVVKAIENSTKAIIESQTEQADAVYAFEGDRIIVEQGIKEGQRYQLPPSPCLSVGTSMASKMAQNAQQVFANVELRGITTRQQTTRNSGDSGLLRNQNANKIYIEENPSTVNALTNADILASSLLYGAGLPNKNKDDTFDATVSTKDQENAARAFILNATSTQALPHLNKNQAKTDEGQKYLAMQRAESAQISLPVTSFSQALASRLKVKNLGAAMGSQWQREIGVPNDISTNHFWNQAVDYRFSNPKWYENISAASPESVARENAILGALNVKLQQKRLEHLERIELLLAQLSLNATSSSSNHTAALTQYNIASSINK